MRSLRARAAFAAQRPSKPAPRRLALLPVILLLLPGCTGELATKGEALRLVGTAVPTAVVHEAYVAEIHAVGGLRPYAFTVKEGSLPPGITLQNGVLRGTPTETGAFRVTVEVSDANLSRFSQQYALLVVAAPPPRLVLDAPLTEVRGPTTVKVKLEDARGLTGVRTLVTFDPEQFTLGEAGPSAGRRDVTLFWEGRPGELQVDLVPLGKTLSGSLELFRFTLVPVTPPQRVRAAFTAEVTGVSLDPGLRHSYLTGVVGAAPEPREQRDAGRESEPEPPEAPGGTTGTDGEAGR